MIFSPVLSNALTRAAGPVFPPARQENERLHELQTWAHNVLVAPSLRYCRACQSIAKHWRKNHCVPTLKY